jgi:transposase
MDILQLPSLEVLSVSTDGGDYSISAQAKPPVTCPHCGGALVGFGRRAQKYNDLPIHGKRVEIAINRRRWRCKNPDCQRVTLDPLPDMDDKRAMTRRLAYYIIEERKTRKITELAEKTGLSVGTIHNISTLTQLLESEAPTEESTPK